MLNAVSTEIFWCATWQTMPMPTWINELLDRWIVHQHALQAAALAADQSTPLKVTETATPTAMLTATATAPETAVSYCAHCSAGLASFWQIHFRAFRDVYKLPPLIKQKMHAPPTTTTTTSASHRVGEPKNQLPAPTVTPAKARTVSMARCLWQWHWLWPVGQAARHHIQHIIISGWTATGLACAWN